VCSEAAWLQDKKRRLLVADWKDGGRRPPLLEHWESNQRLASGQLLAHPMGSVRNLDKYLLGAIGLYLMAGVLLIGSFRYQINPDALSYISIAQHYRDGLWREAVNAYWSPLYSWLLLPFLSLGLDPLLATKILSLTLGCLVLAASWQLAAVVGLAHPFRRILVFALAPVVLQWAYSVVSPDLLTIALLLPFLTLVLRPDSLDNSVFGLLAGLAGGLAYLSKAYALPFVIVVFVMCTVWQALAVPRPLGAIARGTIGFLAGLGMLALPWVAVISSAYHRFTLGTAGRFNFALIGPRSFWYPMLTLGLFPQPNEHALSPWEDPSFLPQRIWSPFSSIENFIFWFRKIVSNWGDLYEMLNDFSVLALPALAAGLYMAIQRMRREHRKFDPGIALLLSLFIFAGGYTLVFLEERYIWICEIGILLGGLFAIQAGSMSNRLGKRWAFVLAVALSLSFALPASKWLRKHRGIDREHYEAARDLPEMRESHFVSNDMTAVYYAYYKGGRFFGLPQGNSEAIARQFNRYGVDRYFLIGSAETPPPYVRESDRIDSGKIANLRVYRVAADHP
jgi:hypothetical protein